MTSKVATPALAQKRVLLVDDDPALLAAQARQVQGFGYEVVCASQADEAFAALSAGRFDAVVSDVQLPGRTGLDILRRIRETDLDLAVVLVTGADTVAMAAEAVAYGAFRYLLKPVREAALEEVVARAVSTSALARARRELLADAAVLGDRAALEVQYQQGLRELWVAFQPIVRWSTRSVVAYEALLRSMTPGLGHPRAMLDVAERLGHLPELGRAMRARAALPWRAAPRPERLFLNLHPTDFLDDSLYEAESLGPLAREVVLEITEHALPDATADVGARSEQLRAMGFRIALDDFGTGRSGLSGFSLLDPEIVKLDVGLVRGIDKSPLQQNLVRAVFGMGRGLEVVAKGVETVAERDMLLSLGCDFFQGYLFGRPGLTLSPVDVR